MTFARLAALLATAVVTHAAHGQERNFGRLFFTAEERARLDAARLEALANLNRPVPPKPVAAPKATPPKVVTLHGVVKRNDGAATVWVNGKAVSARFGDADIGSGSITADSVGLDLPGTRGRVRLKVGQSVEATSGVIEEGYRRRRTLPSAAVPADAPPSAQGDSAPAGGARPTSTPGRGTAKETPDGDPDGNS